MEIQKLKKTGYDSFQLFLEALDKKLGNRKTEQQFNHDRDHEGDEWNYE